MWPEEHRACQEDAIRVGEVTVDNLVAMTGDDCGDCASVLQPMMQALEEGYMTCPLRMAAYIAHVRHGTDGFTVFQNSQTGVAGAIHMLPANWRLACEQIPELKAAFEARFDGCSKENRCTCGSDAIGAAIVAQYDFAFRIGVWWFTTGAAQVLGDPCTDLRIDADYGLGGSLDWTTRESPGTGFQKTTTCTFGFGLDPGRQQRATYFEEARAVYPWAQPRVDLYAAAEPTAARAAGSVGALVVACVATAIAAMAGLGWYN